MCTNIACSVVVITSIWPVIGQSIAVLYLFSVLFGVFTGGYISLAPSCVGHIIPSDRFGEAFGTAYSVVSFA